MREIAVVDPEGRVSIPETLRERLGIGPGDLVLLEIRGSSIVLRRADPFEVLDEILSGVEFDARIREGAERLAEEAASRRLRRARSRRSPRPRRGRGTGPRPRGL